MDELRLSYCRLCQEGGAEPQESVLQRLHELPAGRLDLATLSLTVDTCRALGKLLQREALEELALSDCMLSDEGGQPAAGPRPREPAGPVPADRVGCPRALDTPRESAGRQSPPLEAGA